MGKVVDITGKKYGKLTVISFAGVVNRKATWNCICDCGNTKIIYSNRIRSNSVKSCGCLHKEKILEIRLKHGMSKTKEYRAWNSIRHRCLNPATKYFNNYGGRGISIHPKWESSFEAFLSDVGLSPSPKLTLDRINNDGNYEPGNVRWTTPKVQSLNRRNTLHDLNGKPIMESCIEHNIDYYLVHNRLTRGWSIDKALNTPLRKMTKKCVIK